MKIKTVLLILALAVTSAMAQGGGRGRGPGYSYDPSTETKITGSIEQIKTTDTMCHTGTHLMVKTDTAETEVGLGPAHFLKDQKLELKRGNSVEVIGALATTKQGKVFIARQIATGGKTVSLRDEKGTPAWPRGMCRP